MAHGTPLDSRQRRRAFVSMLIMVPLAGAAADISIPSLPAMGDVFGASRFAVQSTLLVYMASHGVGQIVAGPMPWSAACASPPQRSSASWASCAKSRLQGPMMRGRREDPSGAAPLGGERGDTR